MKSSFVLKGNICQTKDPACLDLHECAYAVCVDGVSKGVFESLPEEYSQLPLLDYGDVLIFPGMEKCFACSLPSTTNPDSFF